MLAARISDQYVRSLQPDIIINNRVDGRGGAMWGMRDDGTMPGDYATPEQEIPGSALRGVPWETCMTMNGHWGYNAADKNFKTSTHLIQQARSTSPPRAATSCSTSGRPRRG
jgi:alpha-L-fucosidase